jgi:hypothetical protein
MKNTLWRTLLLVVGTFTSFASERVATFSALPRGDKMVVHYTSTGCFHFSSYEFTYAPDGEGSFEVEELHMEWSKAKYAQVERSRNFLGRVSLENGEAKKLDALIEFYRQNTDHSCTTVDSIRLSQIRNGRVVAEESFVDGSCAAMMRPELLTFGQMAYALKKAGK